MDTGCGVGFRPIRSVSSSVPCGHIQFSVLALTYNSKCSAPFVNRLAFAGAASAVALIYFAWRTSSPSKQLAMDTNIENDS